jgi:hypothetical protein
VGSAAEEDDETPVPGKVGYSPPVPGKTGMLGVSVGKAAEELELEVDRS